MPWPGQLETGIYGGVSVFRDGHFVVEPPAPLAVFAEEVVDQTLDDLAECPDSSRHGILKCVVPFRPGILLANGRGRVHERASRRKGGGDIGTQLPGKRRK